MDMRLLMYTNVCILQTFVYAVYWLYLFLLAEGKGLLACENAFGSL